jgi:hypothetical protein
MSSKKKQETHPMTDKKHSLTDLYASDIAATAKATGHNPWDIPWNVYIKNSTHKGKSHGLLNQFIASNLWSTIRQTYFPVPKDAVASVELKIFRQGRDTLRRQVALGEYQLSALADLATKFQPVLVKPYVPKHKESLARAVVVEESDWHIGANLNPEEGCEKFGPLEEARAVAKLTEAIISYKKDHRDQSRLILALVGDFIENFLHGVAQSEFIPIQVIRVTDLLSQHIQHCAMNYPQVDIYCAPGNHDRDILVHPKRAVRMKSRASWATCIYGNLQNMFKNVPNVKFHITEKPWLEFELFGTRYYGGHGDNFLTMPNPGKSLDTRSIYHQILKINNAESQKGLKPYRVYMTGHIHTGGVLFIDDGCRLITNAPLIPPDMFAKSVGIHSAVRGQMMFEATPEYPVGDIRLIDVRGSESDSKLDSIIKVNPIFSK